MTIAHGRVDRGRSHDDVADDIRGMTEGDGVSGALGTDGESMEPSNAAGWRWTEMEPV